MGLGVRIYCFPWSFFVVFTNCLLNAGTVVGIHQATTGCVEVVMDEEFVGGTSLQGLCSNFRGKLCVWAHVMKITVDNSKGLVEKMVPQGSGKAAVEKILADIEREVKGQQRNVASAAPEQTVEPQRPTQGFATPTRGGSAGRPRADSASRGKLALSREAKGPPEKGARFTRVAKNTKGGLNRWRGLMKGKTKANKSPDSLSATPYNDAVDASAGLKAMLGVSGSDSIGGNDSKIAITDVSEGLKAMLGVGGPASLPQNPNFAFPPPPQPPIPSPATAADKLMQLMTLQPQMQPVQAPVSSSFNFSYVEEGKDAPEPPPAPQFIPQFSPYPIPPQPMFNPIMVPPIHAAMPAQGNMIGFSDKEFPPLGGEMTRTQREQARSEKPNQTNSTLVPSSTLMKSGN